MSTTDKSHESLLQPGVEDGQRQRARGGARYWLIGLGVILVVLAVVFLRKRGNTAAPNAAQAPADRAIPVTVAIVEQKDVAIWLEGLGNAMPLYTVTVKSQVDGRLDRVLFKEGQAVKAGEVIAQIDPRPFQIALHNAEAALARDEATASNAHRNLDRYQALVEQKLIPQQQVDDQRTLADTSDAATKSDRAQIENARLQLDYAQIKSPIDGVTGVRLVDPGNIVHAADQAGLVIITQLDPMAVIFALPQDDLPRVSRALGKGQLDVEAWSRDGMQKLGAGKLAFIDNQINTTTSTIKLKAMVPNPDRALWPNAFVKARMHLSTEKGAIAVPAAVVQRGPQGTFAYVVQPDNTVQPRPVDVSETQGDTAIIAKGLKPGEKVVADGQNQLRAGAKVQPKAAPAGSSAP